MVADADTLAALLRNHFAPEVGGQIELVIERLEARCRELAIEPPSVDRAERIVRTAIGSHEERFLAGIYERLSPSTRERLDGLLGYVEVLDVLRSPFS